MINKPLVSVCIITYNHQDYIKTTLEGVLKQIIDFEMELIISDDCSSDETQTIISKVLSEVKDISVKFFRQPKNIGMISNFSFALKKCNGEFIALCEGDDYWVDLYKIQKQLDFLKQNKGYGICFHPVKIFNQKEEKFVQDDITRDVPDTTNIEDLARGNFIHTPSVMLKNNFRIPKWFGKASLGDWTLYMIQIKNLKIKKIPGEMAVYRVHENGVWASKSQEFRRVKTLKNVSLLLQYGNFNKKVRNILIQRKGEDYSHTSNFEKIKSLWFKFLFS